MGLELEERLRPFAQVARVATAALNLTLLLLAMFAVQLSRQPITVLACVALFVVVLAYGADRVRRRALAAAARTIDRELIPAGIANSLDALRDTALLRSFVASPGALALLDIPWLVVYPLAVAWLHPQLGLYAVGGVAVLTLAMMIVAGLHRLERNDSLLQDARAANDQAEELVRSSATLVAMGMSQAAIDAWRARHEGFQSRRRDAERGAAQLGELARTGGLALQIGVFAIGAWLVVESSLNAATLVAVALLLGRTLQSFAQLAGYLPSIIAARGARLRLSRRASSIVVSSGSMLAGVRNVIQSLAPGESILIAGPSGSGNTSMAQLLLRVLRDRFELGESVGYVSQEIRLFPGTIADNIARMGPLDSTRVVQAARLAHVHEMIVRLPEGYHTQVGEQGAGLSAGQCRRIALARALYVNPRLVVLDEPCMDLDADGGIALVKTLAALKERGATVVIVGQGTAALEHVDRFAILRDGMLQAIERCELPSQSRATVVPLHPAAPQPL